MWGAQGLHGKERNNGAVPPVTGQARAGAERCGERGAADGWGGWGRAAQGVFLLREAGGGREGSQAGRGAEARQPRDVSPGDGQSGLWSAEGEGSGQDHRSQMGYSSRPC